MKNLTRTRILSEAEWHQLSQSQNAQVVSDIRIVGTRLRKWALADGSEVIEQFSPWSQTGGVQKIYTYVKTATQTPR